jgi:hypothetical protein
VFVDSTGLRTAFAAFVGAVVLAGLSVLVMRPLRELDDLSEGERSAAGPPAAAEPVLPEARTSPAR